MIFTLVVSTLTLSVICGFFKITNILSLQLGKIKPFFHLKMYRSSQSEGVTHSFQIQSCSECGYL